MGHEASGQDLGLPKAGEDEEWDALSDKLQQLQQTDRRRTLKRLSLMFQEDMEPAGQPPGGAAALNLGENVAAHDASHRGQVTSVTVEQSERKLPRFSGAERPKQGEVSFKRWQRAANRLLEETDVSEEVKKRSVLRSLQDTADDIADLHRDKTAKDIFDVMVVQYGWMIDGDDLLVEFYNILQGDKQSTSEYVSDLFVQLGEVVNLKGLEATNMPKVLLKQFIRGTHDEDMLLKLRLEDKVNNPPQFPELIASIRREECKRTERKLRHKKQARAHAAVVKEEEREDPEVRSLRQRVSELEAVAARYEEPEPDPPSTAPTPEMAMLQQRLAAVEKKLTGKRGFVFCYRCGEDAHLATECVNAPNKALVDQKVAERRKLRGQKN